MKPGAWVVVVALVAAPTPSRGQDLARRVSGVEGTVRFSFPTRAGVEICDEGVRVGDRRVWWRGDHGVGRATHCRPGPAEVEVEVRGGRVEDVKLMRDLDRRTPGATDLGAVRAAEAARYLVSLARADATRRAAENALFAATLAGVEGLWRDLLDVARDRSVRTKVRRSALFWVGQEAADAVTEGLADVARDDDEEQDIRDAAVFALSQRPAREAVPILMELARTAERSGTRRSAMFWLAQSDDERVTGFFEAILLRRSGGGPGA